MQYLVQPLTIADEPFLWEMLFEAAHLAAEGATSLDAAKNSPILSRYVKGWGREGDMGVMAIAPQTEQRIGAVWVRLWPEGDRGFGFVQPEIPELAIAVLPEHQGRGVGTQLLKALISVAAEVYPAISLSVRANNPAVRLYERLGFRSIAGSEVVNRTGGISFSMQIDLRSEN
jgi:ribosomal protein S18 acetylase RimI-like enzyme